MQKKLKAKKKKVGKSAEDRTGGTAGCRFPPPWGRRPAGYAASTPVAMPTEGGKRKVYADTPERDEKRKRRKGKQYEYKRKRGGEKRDAGTIPASSNLIFQYLLC